ncbi:putative RNA-binding Zn ribbon-like protein [Mycobacteroides chelonae]|nr:putative RNA-binding Zn ribbon-like protein [Mycobacteroides chelonae]
MADPRPHLGEPLALDLLNTRWMSGDGPQDLLTDVEGVHIWLRANNLHDRCATDQQTREALLTARDAIYRAVKEAQIDDVNTVLSRGAIRRSLTDDGPRNTAEVPESCWLPGWLAADNLLALLAESPERIKQCAHPQCVLFFYDTSKNGARRWHSMATCGNRAKAARHYAKNT